ncbi:radical SAM protein [Candidatus Woesearchaeota archaeon]|nr:radical SAM protein [Candidatus Woesearchaeota archaeon]
MEERIKDELKNTKKSVADKETKENIEKRKLKIIIANPPWPGKGYGTRSNIRWPHRRGDKILTFPIYLAYTLALLKKEGFDAKGIDAVEKEYGINQFVEEVKKEKPSIVFIEVSAPSLNYDLETGFKLKNEVNCLTAFVGPHITYDHKKIIDNYSFVDFCLRGEIEFTARALCYALEKKIDLKSVDGLTYRKDGKTVVNQDRKLIENLDSLPFSDRDDFKIIDYQQAFYAGSNTALMLSSRGCPARCTFCHWPDTFTGHVWRTRSAKNICDEIEVLIRKYNINGIYFDDDTFIVDKEHVKSLCNEMINRKFKLSWHCMARVNNIDEEILSLMKKAGCIEIFYGFESGSEEILKESNKAITKEQIRNAVRITKKADICASGSFIIGLPKESNKTIKETINFAKELRADYVQFALASPFPGTKLYEECKEKGLLCLDSWEDLDGSKGPIIRTEHLSRKELEGVLRKMYINYYTSPSIIIQNLKSINSLSDINRIYRGFKSVVSRVLFYGK